MARHGRRTEAEKEESSMNTQEKPAKKAAKKVERKVAPARVIRSGARDTFMAPADPTNPAHYRSHASGVECIQITEHLGFCLGNAVKYIWRSGERAERTIEDLRKSRWYLDREISRLEAMEKPIPYRLVKP